MRFKYLEKIQKEGAIKEKKFVVSLDGISSDKTQKDANKVKDQIDLKDTINKLNNFGPKISYKYRNNICRTEPNENLENIKKLGELSCSCEPRKSGFMCNINDYCISEADQLDENKFFYLPRKPEVRYNLIKDKIETIQGPPYPVPRWNAFYEK